MSRTRVVITGMGCVTPLGADVAATWAGLVAGKNAIGPIQRFDPTGFPTSFAAEVHDYRPPRLEGRFARWCDDKSRFALAAAEEALGDAGLDLTQVDRTRVGVSIGAEVSRPDLPTLAERAQALATLSPNEAYESIPPRDFVVMSAFFPATAMAYTHGLMGPNLTTSTACTSSAQSVADALRILRRGDADVMLAGGADRLVEELMVMGFGLLGALSTRNDDPAHACRPFDRTRDGFVLGEGAGRLVLERLGHGKPRGARVHAELLGYGCSANAWRITDSPPDGRGARASMKAALDDAGLGADAVDYINAHGTSTQQNDTSESAGIHAVFGDRRVPVSSTKSMMGHLVAACGAVELIACVKAIQTGILPPTINHEFPDPTCDLDCVPNEARPAKVEHALTNAFGFGGSNGSLVVGRFAP
ncbi:MAG: beta-ketoacyl-[acyl-carrier-protein] synthase family protein [Myxococcales bacterium]|nr:beta-ketoacyl-[acyl-carrier-protein] synthase family protein [Myxococcales bacterium]